MCKILNKMNEESLNEERSGKMIEKQENFSRNIGAIKYEAKYVLILLRNVTEIPIFCSLFHE